MCTLMVVQRRRAPVIGFSLMAFLVAGFLASSDSAQLRAQVNGSDDVTPSENIVVTPENERASVSPFPEVRGTSIVIGLIILAVGGGILAYAKRR